MSARRLALAAALLAAGCCVNPADPPPPTDPCRPFGCGDAGGPFFPDGGVVPPGNEICSLVDLGAPCERECASPGLTCFRERRTSTSVPLEGTDGGVATLEAVAFPGGLCSASCAVDSDCGWCARCVPHALAGRARLRGLVGGGVCRPRCDVDRDCGEGFACDEDTGTCMEACTGDEQCRFATVDVDGDGIEDALEYQAESTSVCTLGRCTSGAPPLLDRCTTALDCPTDYVCLGPEDRAYAGRCARAGCTEGSCGEGATCVTREDGSRVCATACELGADLEGERVGVVGRGAGCDPGFACVWTGASDATGACLPGNYNAVAEPNVGDLCTRDRDCFSPYGRGLCLRARPGEPNGACAVYDCVASGEGNLAPGITVAEPPVVCDTAAGATCFDRAEGRARSLCVQTCEQADACLPGWACVAVPGGGRACFPDCTGDEDCRTGTSCVAPGGAPCTESDLGCACQ